MLESICLHIRSCINNQRDPTKEVEKKLMKRTSNEEVGSH